MQGADYLEDISQMDLIKTIELSNWRDFTKLKKKLCTGDYIFRGHTNSFDNNHGETDEWKINSSYKRYLEDRQVSFDHFIKIYLNERLFKMHFNIYKHSQTKSLINSTLIEKLYFFQHYGLPTCFIDFTKDPFFALFFAISGIKVPIIKTVKNKKPATFPDNQFFTVIQLHLKTLIEKFGIKPIVDPNIEINYSQYSLNFFGFKNIKVGFDLNPCEKIKTFKNKNLLKQKGCFLLFDNSQLKSSYDLEKVMNSVITLNKIMLTEPLITKYRIPYNSIFRDTDISLFTFLDNHRATGRFLFNDIQGIKYDIMHYLT